MENEKIGGLGMTAKRFTIENDVEMKDNWNINKRCYHFGNGFDAKDCCNMLNELQNENKQLKKENEQLKRKIQRERTSFTKTQERWSKEAETKIKELSEENEQLKEENNKLHTRIFEMRTNIALERTEISKQTYTGKKNEKEYLTAKEFLDEIEKW